MRPVIIGIDPGTTTAFAVLDFDGKPVFVKSRRNYGLSDLIFDVYEHGLPIIIGTDKKDIPLFVKDFSQKTGGKVATTRYDTKKGEKKTKVKIAGMQDLVTNAHETDALAAAIYAYERYLPLIRKIDSYLEKSGNIAIREDIITLLVDESRLSIKRAAEILKKEPVKIMEKQVIKHTPVLRKILSSEERQILLLTSQNIKLKQKIADMNSKAKTEYNKRIDIGTDIKKKLRLKELRVHTLETQVSQMKKGISNLQRRIDKNRYFLQKVPRSVVLKRFDHLGYDYFSSMNRSVKVRKGDIIYVKDISRFSRKTYEEIKNQVSIIVYSEGKNRILSKSFILIKAKISELEISEYFVLMDAKIYVERLEKQDLPENKIPVKEMLTEYKRMRKLQNE